MNYSESDIPSAEAVRLLESDVHRQVVAFLLEVKGTWDIRTLADELVRLDPAISPDFTVGENPVEERATRLHHGVLPALAAVDAVILDRKEQTVAPGERLEDLGLYLDNEFDFSETAPQFAGPSAKK